MRIERVNTYDPFYISEKKENASGKVRTGNKRNFAAIAVIAAVIVTAVLYYCLFYIPICREMEKVRSEIIEAEEKTETEKGRLQAGNRMSEENDRNRKAAGTVGTFDNAESELKELNEILAGTKAYSAAFSDPYTTDGIYVRREVQLSFTADSYSAARKAIVRIINGENRCMIRNYSITDACSVSAGDFEGFAGKDMVSVTAEIVFIETTVGMKNDKGLIYRNGE